MIPLLLIVIAALSYFIGTISSARILAQFIMKKPLRKKGYVGFSDMDKMYGRKWALALFALDVVKTLIPVMIGWLLMKIPGSGFTAIGALFAGFCASLGDMYPYQTKLHGGQGVVVLVTAMWIADWRIGVTSIAVFLIVLALSQYMSVASLSACLGGAAAAWIFIEADKMKGIAGLILIVATLFVIWRYRGNISRLANSATRDREPKVNWGRQPESRLDDDDF